MRQLTLMTMMVLVTAGGCARSRPSTATLDRYSDGAASSLVFTPPIAIGMDPVELAREEREPAAFVGIDEVSTSYFYIRTDDRQTDDGTDRFVRRSVIEKVGVSYR